MLVGEPPYAGANAQAVLAKILAGDTPAPTVARSTIPPNVDAAIRRALEKLPADRFTGAQDFARALADPAFTHGRAARAGVAPKAGPWKAIALAATGLAAVLAVFAGRSMIRSDAPRSVIRFSIDAPDPTRLPDLSISRDGARLAYTAAGPGGQSQLWIRSLNEGDGGPGCPPLRRI